MLAPGHAFNIVLLFVFSIGIALVLTLGRTGRWKASLRRLAALDAIDEAVGRSTEMGRPIIFSTGWFSFTAEGGVYGPQVLAGISILGYLAESVGRYGTELISVCGGSDMITLYQETIRQSYLKVGRPELYRMEQVIFTGGPQTAYTTTVMNVIDREKAAAFITVGPHAGDALNVLDSAGSVGAIVIGGTARSNTLPWFAAACDYSLLAEELYAASAYVRGDYKAAGLIAVADILKGAFFALIVVGAILMTFGNSWLVNFIMT